ncbi:MAG TPA: Ppx/GppA phosphatase family protein [Planctomycetota bacterium]|nr:Ppx/GppA phosphatase family protein [Planctomycetota bacterium]
MTLPTDSQNALAAVDLGSNSFHLVVAVERQGELVLLDRIRERIGLAEGLTDDGQLDEFVAERALGCLQRFGERLRGIPDNRVRAVGTATFRDIRDGRRFLRRAQANLGHEIETLPGKEEARLIYLGVAHSLGDDEAGRLVFDIGGGSTEIIVGRQFESLGEASVSLGCIHHTKRFFANGELTRKAFKRAVLGARLEIEPITEAFQEHRWTQCVGASGTILAVSALLDVYANAQGVITPSGLDKLIDLLCDAGHVKNLHLEGLADDRRGVLAGGLAIVKALFEEFSIQEMRTAPGALRDGLLYDLLGRMHHEDVRFRSVVALARRFGTHHQHTENVLHTGESLFEQVREEWNLKRRHQRLLVWGIMLAEIGMSVSYSGYQRHGGYLIENSDMAGFSSERQAVLAQVVRCHRRRIRPDDFAAYEESEARKLKRMASLIRIAHRLNRIRNAPEAPPVQAQAKGKRLHLIFPTDWLEQRSLVQEDLEQEAQHLNAWEIQLSFV